LLEQGFRAENVMVLDQAPREDGFAQGRLPLKENIVRELGVLRKLAGPDDTVIVALTGHGVQLEKNGRRTSYFCPADADLNRVESLLGLDALYDMLGPCRAKLTLLMVDACRKEPVIENAKVVPRFKSGMT